MASAIEPLCPHRQSIPNGEPSSPPGTGVPFHLLKENTLDAIHVTKVLRPVGVLLGGSGLARMLLVRAPQAAALTKSRARVPTQAQENRESGTGLDLSHAEGQSHVA